MTHRGNTPARAVSRSNSLALAGAHLRLAELEAYVRRAVQTREDGETYRPLLERLQRELARETARLPRRLKPEQAVRRQMIWDTRS
jgi:hypothetical protein